MWFYILLFLTLAPAPKMCVHIPAQGRAVLCKAFHGINLKNNFTQIFKVPLNQSLILNPCMKSMW